MSVFDSTDSDFIQQGIVEPLIFSKYNPPEQVSYSMQGLVFTEAIGYMTVAQQVQRFISAGVVLENLQREEFLKNYQFANGEDDGSDPSFLTLNPTELDVLMIRKSLLDSYGDKLSRGGKVEDSSTLAAKENPAPSESGSEPALNVSEDSK